MNEIDKLAEYFTKFPGIGVRQAKRFVYYLLTRDSGTRTAIARLIEEIGKTVRQCALCGRFSTDEHGKGDLCSICLSPTRQESLLVVEKDADLERIERSGAYKGRYFVLGGIVPLAAEDPGAYIRLSALKKHLEHVPKGLREVILGLSVTPDGEHTAETLKDALMSALDTYKIALTHLGRGLSTGSEIEYADRATIENALAGRK